MPSAVNNKSKQQLLKEKTQAAEQATKEVQSAATRALALAQEAKALAKELENGTAETNKSVTSSSDSDSSDDNKDKMQVENEEIKAEDKMQVEHEEVKTKDKNDDDSSSSSSDSDSSSESEDEEEQEKESAKVKKEEEAMKPDVSDSDSSNDSDESSDEEDNEASWEQKLKPQEPNKKGYFSEEYLASVYNLAKEHKHVNPSSLGITEKGHKKKSYHKKIHNDFVDKSLPALLAYLLVKGSHHPPSDNLTTIFSLSSNSKKERVKAFLTKSIGLSEEKAAVASLYSAHSMLSTQHKRANQGLWTEHNHLGIYKFYLKILGNYLGLPFFAEKWDQLKDK